MIGSERDTIPRPWQGLWSRVTLGQNCIKRAAAHRHEDAAVDDVVAQEGVLLGELVRLLEASACPGGGEVLE